MSKPTFYPLILRLLHWLMALIVFALLITGFSMVQTFSSWQPNWLTLHKTLGVLAAILIIVRLIVRLSVAVPELPKNMASWQRESAYITQAALYVFLLLMPASGYLMQNAAGIPVYFFGYPLPSLLGVDLSTYGMLREIHGICAMVLTALIVMHISAALQHGLIKRDGVLSSMTGRGKHLK